MSVEKNSGGEHHTGVLGQLAALLAAEVYLGDSERMVGAHPFQDLLGVVAEAAVGLCEQRDLGGMVHEIRSVFRSLSRS